MHNVAEGYIITLTGCITSIYRDCAFMMDGWSRYSPFDEEGLVKFSRFRALFPAFLGNYDRQTDQPPKPINQTDGHEESVCITL